MNDPAGTPPSDEPRLIAGRYRLGRLLGSGGMADVYRATDERLHRPVAVKVLRPGDPAAGEGEAAARARFTAEGRMVAQLNHPAIVSIFDAGEDGERAFLVMECMPGTSLRDRLGQGPFAEGEVKTLLTDVLGALAAAHQAGVVHRDVKPGNVLATTDGRWKVADFGIAQADGLVPDTGDLTSTGLLVGTPRYVAPERFAGHRATVASDLYSVGVVLDEVLAESATPSPALAAVAARARAVDPDQRFASAASMAAAVEGATTVAALLPTAPDAPGATTVLPLASTDAPTAISGSEATAVLARGAPQTSRARPARARWWAVSAVALLAAGALALGLGAARGDDPSAPTAPTPATTSTSASPTTVATTTTPPTTATPTTAPVVVTTTPRAEPPRRSKDKDPKGKHQPAG
ncbi:MAG: serine/threonine protein kinase [Acidimicrobiales bacterium]|nr:serine/threonine protein kinase [Acidimicrobiales bacterium]